MRIRFLLFLLIVASIAVPYHPHAAQAGAVISPGCAALRNSAFDSSYRADKVDALFYSGDTITVSVTGPKWERLVLKDKEIEIIRVPLDNTTGTASATYQIPTTGDHIIRWKMKFDSEGSWQVDCNPLPAPVAPAPVSKTPVPGPDMIPIPSGAAVGTFVSDMPLYYAPRMDALSRFTMKSGQSLWVFGMSTDGTFYQVVLAGQKLWVPVASLGPTTTPPWNGHALPVTVVE